jgi:hypothetical protein
VPLQETLSRNKPVLSEHIFYGNFFYGICAISQAIESSLQQGFPLNNVFYYVITFIATVFYYNYPYSKKSNLLANDPRSQWYKSNKNLVHWTQRAFGTVIVGSMLCFVYLYFDCLTAMSPLQWTFTLLFPAVSILYYGINVFTIRYNLRKTGWLKPFIIGFTWSGMVSIYPILFYTIIHKQDYEFTSIGCLLFMKNTMFISILAIMFDIKDYADDRLNNLNTIVVKMGIRKTIFNIVIPLPILGLLTFLSYAALHHYHFIKMVFIMVPFFLLILAGLSLRKRRNLLYYLIVIDGLMVVKAAFGIVAMLV